MDFGDSGYEFEDDDLLGPKMPKKSFKETEEAFFEDSSEGESGDATTGVATGDNGALKPRMQLRRDLSSHKREELINKLLNNSVALAQFLRQLKLNRYTAGTIKQIVLKIAKSNHPRAVFAISRIFDATPKMNLRREMKNTIAKLNPKLSERLNAKPKPKPKPALKRRTLFDPRKIPENRPDS